jgi:diguanylate cyclase (GGDEF)-like protein/PAS domain S-box-containing protein
LSTKVASTQPGFPIEIAGDKQAEEALRKSESSLLAVLQSTADGILAVGNKNEVLFANERFEKLWRIPQAVMTSKDDSVLLQYILDQLSDPQSFLKKVQELYKSKEESFDTLNFKDGRVFERQSRPFMQGAGVHGRVWSFRDITERKQIEEKLEQDRILLRTLIDNLPDRIFVMDGKGRKIISNMADLQAAGGKKMEDVIGKTDLEIYPPELGQDFWAVDKSVIESGIPIVNREEFGLDSQGNLVSVLSTKVPLRDGQGKVIGLVGTGRDITERKRAEEILRQSEERFHSLFKNMMNGFAYCQMIFEKGVPQDFIYLEVNDAFEEITGLKDVVGKKVTDIIPGIREADPELFKTYGRVALTGKPESFDMYIASLQVWHSVSLYSPQKEHFVSVFNDITERKQVEQAQQQSEFLFRALFEASPDAVMLIDPHDPNDSGPIIDCNAVACVMNGYSREELIGHSIDILNETPVSPAANIAYLNHIRKSGNLRYETIHRHKNGTIFPIEVSTTLIQVGERELLMGIDRDITGRKHMEEEIRNLSLTDALTGLYNRRGFTLLAEQEVKLAHRIKRSMLLFFGDVDSLKTINDSYGHAQGDLALQDISAVLKETFREADILARIGGDEFVVLAVDASMESTDILTDRIQAALKKRKQQGDQPYRLSLSLGIAHYDPEAPCTVSEMIAQADGRMYQQKQARKGK